MKQRRKRHQRKRRQRAVESKQSLPIAALHESAHAVVAELGGIPVDHIHCIPGPVNEQDGSFDRGVCVLKKTDGEVPIPNRVSGFFYFLVGLASFPIEKLLGIDTARIAMDCSSDWRAVLRDLPDDVADKQEAARVFIDVVSVVVEHPVVLRAIKSVATSLLEKKRLEGAEVRELMNKSISEEFFTGPERQQTLLESNLVEYVWDVFGSDTRPFGQMWEDSHIETYNAAAQQVLYTAA